MSTPSVLQESQSPVQSGKNPFYEDLVFIKVKDSLLRVDIDDILFLEADRSYCKIHLSGGKVVHFCCSLSKIVEQLHSPCFKQVHRSYVVNIHRVCRIDSGRQVFFGESLSVPMSRHFERDFLYLFTVLGSSKVAEAPAKDVFSGGDSHNSVAVRPLPSNERLLVTVSGREGSSFALIDPRQIVWISRRSAENTLITCHDGSTLSCACYFDTLTEAKLLPEYIRQVNGTHMVNVFDVKAIRGHEIKVGDSYFFVSCPHREEIFTGLPIIELGKIPITMGKQSVPLGKKIFPC